MEVCVDNIQAAFNAESGGANRILLCSVLRDGGLTPSLGMFQVIKQRTKIPVFVLIRPNLEENYVYTDFEIEAMRNDIDKFKTNGANGFIFSLLKPSRSVNLSACKELLDTAAPLPVTFGRGFDFIISQFEAMETIIKLGFKRILTCGQASTAEKGCGMIRKLILMAHNRIIIMPAGGITEFNLQKILNKSKAAEVQINYKNQFFTNKESVKLMLKIASDVQEHKLKQYRLLQNCRFGRRNTDSL